MPLRAHRWGKRCVHLSPFVQTKPMSLKDSWSPRSFMHLRHVLPCHCMSSLQPSYLFCLWPFNRFPWHHWGLQSFAVCTVIGSIVNVSKRVINCMSTIRGDFLFFFFYTNCAIMPKYFRGEEFVKCLTHQTHTRMLYAICLFALQHWIRTIFSPMKYANEHLVSGRHIWQLPPHSAKSRIFIPVLFSFLFFLFFTRLVVKMLKNLHEIRLTWVHRVAGCLLVAEMHLNLTDSRPSLWKKTSGQWLVSPSASVRGWVLGCVLAYSQRLHSGTRAHWLCRVSLGLRSPGAGARSALT